MNPSGKDPLRTSRFPLTRLVELALLMVAACFLTLHCVHLRADFPNHSPWMDWAKYTDEGWYGDAATREVQRGSWYVPGDFNPAAALPVWPLAELAVFHFTGATIVAARALSVTIFALIVLCSYLLLARGNRLAEYRDQASASLAPAIGVVLLSVSPFCYAFSRMAILEPMLILLTALGILVASYLEPQAPIRSARFWLPIALLGIVLPLMVLTKTTAVFLLPAVGWMLFARCGYSLRGSLRPAVPVLLLAALVWAGYYGLVVRPRFLEDYKYLFSANAYTGITRETAMEVVQQTILDGAWIGKLLYPLSLVAMVCLFLYERRQLRNPVVPSLLLWIAGYAAFLAYHDNLQPRYYLVVAVPLTLVVAIVLEGLWNRRGLIAPLHRLAAVASVAALALVAAGDARETLRYARHPEYTFANAAERIHSIVRSDAQHNPLVLSISGSDLSLMTGLPSICDDFGTMELSDRVRAYKPGWYIAWNQVDDDKMEALTPLYHLERVAQFPAMDDPERNLLILYRLVPRPAARPKASRRRAEACLMAAGLGGQSSCPQKSSSSELR